eukprot:Gb_37581 [translate_table: standard]
MQFYEKKWMRAVYRSAIVWILTVAVAAADADPASDAETQPKTYIVHMAKWQMPASYATQEHWYASTAKALSAKVVYNYNVVFHGFATRLTPAQVRAMEKSHGILSVHPDTVFELHTTRTPGFLGLNTNEGLWPESEYGEDIIVGVLDTGIWPESKSFDDTGLGPVPSKWKGDCQGGPGFNCNKKLIGARFFSKGYEALTGPINETRESRSPRDQEGHGSHTASTAAGSLVSNASLLGYAEGTASGMANRARLAAYKVCWEGGCFSSDILAAMDQAIADGVDVLSLSLGGSAGSYDRDSIAIGAFGAMENGIFVSCSAGNAGPNAQTLSNVAPWITTVGAGTLDRDFPAYAVLGNGKKYAGVSLSSGKDLGQKQLDLVYAGNASSSNNGNLCLNGTLDSKLVAGKIVFCERGINARVEKGAEVKAAGGVAMILANTEENGEELVADAHLLPATAVGQKNGVLIKEYIKSVSNPTATIEFKGTVLGIKPAPVVAAFSSRGPNSINPEVLKPDIIAPGVNILAAWTGSTGPTGLKTDTRRVSLNIISGTSMSCPHVTGLAALLKGARPEWSPAAIKSALMTTAYVLDNTGNSISDTATGNACTPFDHGAGHVDPQKALDPGLIYDISVEDYLEFLCSLNYTPAQIMTIAKKNFTCDSTKITSPADLNYPSFSVVFPSNSFVVKYTRTVTNVGRPGLTYNVTAVSSSDLVTIQVEPQTLYFKEQNEKQNYKVTFTTKPLPPVVQGSTPSSFGSLTWTDGSHTVRSPIAFSWLQHILQSL